MPSTGSIMPLKTHEVATPLPLYSQLHSRRATRLLALGPGQDNDPIIALLYEVSLDDKPEYEGLSYTWGNAEDNESITVNGLTINIRQNLAQSLRRLRFSDAPRILWIDALSISQTDPIEKAQQVEIIGDIFQSAFQVLVWLGEHADGSQAIFHEWLDTGLQDEKPLDEDLESRAKTWTKFVSRPYWRRTWIVQEVVGARKLVLHCGPDAADWEQLIVDRVYPYSRSSTLSHVKTNFKFINHEGMDRFIQGVSDPLPTLLDARKSFSPHLYTDGMPHGPSIFLTTVAKDTECFDRKDKVYALLSLEWTSAIRDSIKVDYTISVSQLFAMLLEAMSKLEIIHGIPLVMRLCHHIGITRKEVSNTVDLLLGQPKVPNSFVVQALYDLVLLLPETCESLTDYIRNAGDGDTLDQRLNTFRRWHEDARTSGIWPVTSSSLQYFDI